MILNLVETSICLLEASTSHPTHPRIAFGAGGLEEKRSRGLQHGPPVAPSPDDRVSRAVGGSEALDLPALAAGGAAESLCRALFAHLQRLSEGLRLAPGLCGHPKACHEAGRGELQHAHELLALASWHAGAPNDALPWCAAQPGDA